MRVIVTGSRTWTGTQATVRLHGVLTMTLAFSTCLDDTFTLVHGDCPQGADALADAWARRHDQEVTLETYPADWSRGKRGGFLRNQQMVRLGADLVLAFQRDGSRGTQHTIDLAEGAGIYTPIIRWEPSWSDATAQASRQRQILAGMSEPFGREQVLPPRTYPEPIN